MKRMLTGIIIGLFAGLLLGGVIIFLSTPSLIFKENQVEGDFDLITAKLEEAAMDAGWKIPHVHDLQAIMKKFDKDVSSVKIYDICNPVHSYEILSRDQERIVSNLMPCRIAVYEKSDGTTWISRMNSGIVAKPMSRVIRKTMSAAAADVEEIIAEVLKD